MTHPFPSFLGTHAANAQPPESVVDGHDSGASPRRGLLPARRALVILASSVALAACGGGSGTGPSNEPNSGGGGSGGGGGGGPVDPAPTVPQIASFTASASQVFVGESVTLQGSFSGGAGRIEPLLGDVTSGQSVSSGPLDRDQLFRLVVQAPGKQDAERELTVRVGFRDSYFTPGVQFAGAGHAAVMTADGSVLLIGGARPGPAGPEAISRYRPQGHGLIAAGQLLQPRVNPVVTRLTDGRILVTGGALDAQDPAAAELLDERTAVSEPAGRMSVVRSDHAAAPLAGGRVLITGGVALGEGTSIGISASAEIWDPVTRSFRRLGSAMRTPRAFHTMTVLGDGRVLIVGGHTTAELPVLAEIFDPVTEQFTPVPTALPMRALHAALTAPDGSVLVLGGEMQHPESDDPVPTDSVLRYDPTRNQFGELPSLSVARSAPQAVMLPNGAALVFGGRSAEGVPMPQAERVDPDVGNAPIAMLPDPRLGHTATRLSDGRILIAGGDGPAGGFASRLFLYR